MMTSPVLALDTCSSILHCSVPSDTLVFSLFCKRAMLIPAQVFIRAFPPAVLLLLQFLHAWLILISDISAQMSIFYIIMQE